MKSPITGKEMVLKNEKRKLPFRKEEYEVDYVFYECTESNEEFTDERTTDLNLNQVYNQYRERHHVPFPEEIIITREKYGLSQAKMAEVLGIGVNNYRGYESGDIPSESNSTLIKLAEDPAKFFDLVKMKKEHFTEREFNKVVTHIQEEISKNKEGYGWEFVFKKEPFDYKSPGEYTGYKVPNIEKLEHMILYYIENCPDLWTTKLNKLLFYGDFLNYQRTGNSISGAAYQAIPLGPVPYKYHNVYDKVIENNKVIAKEEFVGQTTGYKFYKNGTVEFNKEIFSTEELKTLANVARQLGKNSVKEIVEISHKEEAWLKCNENKEIISYKKFGLKLHGDGKFLV
jgi:putative zinc finger/helix-turn-helix YgiT family protein